MEQVNIWFFTDNDHGSEIAESIKSIGLTINSIEGYEFSEAYIDEDEINIIIIDIDNSSIDNQIKKISTADKLSGFPKFIIVPEKDINNLINTSYNVLHLEFLSKPLDKREFLLLLEKSIIVERYREMMKHISIEAENRIETYESLMNIHRKNILDSDKEKEAFEKILSHEKNILKEQAKFNNAIKEFTLLRQSEYFDLKNRIKAEEMLANLRQKEMIDAKNIIDAQESVIDYSAHELDEFMKILSATENVAELSRSEAIELHNKLKDQIYTNEKLNQEVERLKKEIHELKQT